VIYQVRVEFNRDFLEMSGSDVTIGIKSKPVKGQANKEIIKKIATYLKIPVSEIRIISGHKSRTKIIEVP